jgi:hypothetical protein
MDGGVQAIEGTKIGRKREKKKKKKKRVYSQQNPLVAPPNARWVLCLSALRLTTAHSPQTDRADNKSELRHLIIISIIVITTTFSFSFSVTISFLLVQAHHSGASFSRDRASVHVTLLLLGINCLPCIFHMY